MVAPLAAGAQFVGFDGRHHLHSDLNRIGTPECIPFRERIFRRCGSLANAARAEYLHLAASESYVQANRRLLKLDSQLNLEELNLSCSLGELIEFADAKSRECLSIKEKTSDIDQCFRSLSRICLRYSLKPPLVSTDRSDLQAAVNRICCPKWWRRQLRKLQADRVERVARDLRQVHFSSSPYCSRFSVARRRQQKIANQNYLENTTAINELDQEFTLAQLSEVSVSNPAIRRIELVTRAKGFEVIANEYGLDAVFITMTAPSRFHRMVKITRNGKVARVIPNKKYEGYSPRETQEYLSGTWAKIQAKLSRLKIKPFGFRIAEPHHDGTPHWHFLLFASSDHLKMMKEVFREYVFKDTPEENGAYKHRFKVEEIKKGINPKTGREFSATGYLIKYICKSIDGHGVDNSNENQGKDWANKDAHIVAENIESWSRTHRIRQFQQIGGPSVTVYREMRRLAQQEGIVESVRQAADAGDWAEFVRAMGGPAIPRKDQTLRPAYAHARRLDRVTGELVPVTKTQYGDEATERVVGVLVAGVVVLSRTHVWEIHDSAKLHEARKKIMEGIADVLEEIQSQNTFFMQSIVHSVPCQRGALDLCQ